MSIHSTRQQKLVAVSAGRLYRLDSGRKVDVGLICDPNAEYVYSTVIDGIMYFVDGTNYSTYNGFTGAIGSLTATEGDLPADLNGRKCRLITSWTNSLVLAGLGSSAQTVFVSRQSVPTDFDYAVNPVDAQMAFAGTMEDKVTGLFVMSRNVLMVGCDHTIWQFTGRPTDGGRVDKVTDQIGIAWGRAGCLGPDGTLYFWASKGGIWSLQVGGKPARISHQIVKEMRDINTADHVINMLYDDQCQGIHVWVTNLDETKTCTHYFYELRSGAWQRVIHRNKDHNPKTVFVVDGDDPEDRRIAIGSWDGWVRTVDPTAKTDDGQLIDSYVDYGPILTQNADLILWKRLTATFSDDTEEAKFSLRVGDYAEAAASAMPTINGTWLKGRNTSTPLRRSGYALYMTVHSTKYWAVENMHATWERGGEIAGR